MKKNSTSSYDGLALFSGGLDSILAARIIQEQGLRVLGLHFVSPFFGHPGKIREWEDLYQIPLKMVDVSSEFVNMLCQGPAHGLGKTLNPCIDCKILMLTRARQLLKDFGADFIISGEVIGQRPMSQRRDALDIIKRDADVKDVLVRALSARLLPPTGPEQSGLIDREKLGAVSGRGRKEQLRMARKFGISPIPTPAGGCLLTEKESAKRYLPVLISKKMPGPADLHLANTGRQLWHKNHWLCIGRNQDDNARLASLADQSDYLIKLKSFPGPLGLARPLDSTPWPEQVLESACRLMSGFSPKARQSGLPVQVLIRQGDQTREIQVGPDQPDPDLVWTEPIWDQDLVQTFKTIQEKSPPADTQDGTDH
ncbi:tRNA (5-methylaminomethyl-2-thiouridylate)-methyltransferase [Desulfonatronovibrio hydrogenovorans]|uniref:tRNA (5-methylaminomethyl-2-thiouridylate)-methyltransferase n=1 Tax=Desulfonatronovibrio hydrogenovorans TaxID=53245 RepID=UPI00048E2A8C|nr:tRNA (5-methylaminomethyl-2-thiouridylate)-methyltransferase [Desulfonatronovibrio hydrogenovorans]